MSVPPRYDVSRVCNFPFVLPNIPFINKHKASAAVYAAGAIFAIANWVFLDACIVSAHTKPLPDAPYEPLVHVTFVDWIPGILSILGLLIVNLVNKAHLRNGDTSGYGGEGRVIWMARLFLFLGFALMAGGLAGSVTVLVLKYLTPGHSRFMMYGYANIIQNAGVMLSAIVLWISGTMEGDEYDYQLTL